MTTKFSTPTIEGRRSRRSQDGFTLIEALIATLVLSFGLISISNLMIVSTSTNYIANQSTAATMIAAQQLETLRSTAFVNMTVSPSDTLNSQVSGWNAQTNVAGVGNFITTWRIQAVSVNTRFIQVRTESLGFLGRRTRAEFTTYRSCTLPNSGCPS